ncbi:MAG: DUF924 domain-containing protein [Burkholderiales bacterium]|nr:MAG: DUF924 domain-containing protein [Burkholderiales bacterium]
MNGPSDANGHGTHARRAPAQAAIPPQAQAVLAFWFDPQSRAGRAHEVRPEWFRKDPDFDAAIRERFGALLEQAAEDGLAEWGETPPAALARLIVCDQFPRNLFRDSPRAFAFDATARGIARTLVAGGGHLSLHPLERWFAYLPFEHSESLADQLWALALFATLRDDPMAGGAYEWAVRHHEVIARFGRFPHRNQVLGRDSTPEELAFLAQPGSRF